MDPLFEKRLGALHRDESGALVAGGRKGIEKESLRIGADGHIAQTPHPAALGSALTHQYITTDYSEALLEFVTPAHPEIWRPIQTLCDIHCYAYRHLGEELLWATSMPCALGGDETIPVARYGSSNVGTMKRVYRLGLGHRYGRVMQTISGVHFNYSLPEAFWPAYRELSGASVPIADFKSESYLGLLRNFWRCGWIILYLFGSSPAVCKSFFGGRDPQMPEFDDATAYEPHATSLRMSDLGYTNTTQAKLDISLNSLDEYIAGLSAAIETPHPEYEKIGVNVGGEYRQLNANLLQIENEYYSAIRPKRVARSGEKPTHALRRGGVEYVEVRALDVSAFDPVGVNQRQLRFLEAFLIYCLLRDSPPLTPAEKEQAAVNQNRVARAGRDPGCMLSTQAGPRTVREWAGEIIDAMAGICEQLDSGEAERGYGSALAEQRAVVADPELTPSARILAEMREEGESFFQFAMRMSGIHKAYFLDLDCTASPGYLELQREARESIERQKSIEARDTLAFEEYLERYFAQ